MKVDTSTITKIRISDVHGLGPVTVFIEDHGVRAKSGDHETCAGNLTISCYGQSWTCYWGSMGPSTVAQFVTSCDADYILNCLSRGLSGTQFSGNALVELASKRVIDRRRRRNVEDWEDCYELSKHDARSLYDQIDELGFVDAPAGCMAHDELLSSIFGGDWGYQVSEGAVEPNPDYTYLKRIVEAVQQALASQLPVAA
ncbi:hypothetical protein CS390_15325 [Pseudomonas sp. HLS-6]|uniref:hypothetical protein n=1 Tax=Pseudomonas sp. HLS-6 TaxID=2049589 RepID=UPI000C183459|nr:hypothetical protein [Pseudomonas sp. HLS-6]ATR83812.1 hypothetical protein CS390_15325 [Pseudomonas sp. HLS-6]